MTGLFFPSQITPYAPLYKKNGSFASTSPVNHAKHSIPTTIFFSGESYSDFKARVENLLKDVKGLGNKKLKKQEDVTTLNNWIENNKNNAIRQTVSKLTDNERNLLKELYQSKQYPNKALEILFNMTWNAIKQQVGKADSSYSSKLDNVLERIEKAESLIKRFTLPQIPNIQKVEEHISKNNSGDTVLSIELALRKLNILGNQQSLASLKLDSAGDWETINNIYNDYVRRQNDSRRLSIKSILGDNPSSSSSSDKIEFELIELGVNKLKQAIQAVCPEILGNSQIKINKGTTNANLC